MELTLNNIKYRNIKGFNLKVKEGLINGIFGLNGSGKSSLMDIMSFIKNPSDGNIVLDGMTINKNNYMVNYDLIRFDVCYIMQNPKQQFFCNTVKEQIMYYLKQYNYKTNDNRIIKSLQMVELDESYIDREINSLSSSEIFKVALASVVALNPKILILDEPSIYLDNKSKKMLFKIIRTMKQRYNKTIIILSYNLDFLIEISDYLYVINEGQKIFEGTKQDVFKNDKILEKNGIRSTKTIEFSKLVEKEKGIKIGYRDNMNDLIKDIYFYVH